MMTPPSKPWILGLTGGIGSGKSAAAEHFAALGIHVVDADHAARWVVELGRPALASIAEHFGAQVLQADGQLNRGALRHLIFTDPEQRRWLEALLHPLIREEIANNLAQAKSPYAILVSPLLPSSLPSLPSPSQSPMRPRAPSHSAVSPSLHHTQQQNSLAC